MKIYFDGCSWTKGEELENQEEERFSKLICNKLGAEETNLAIKGGSNDRIIRNLLVENNIEEYDLAVIQMTFPARTEYYDERGLDKHTNKWVRVNPKQNYSDWLNGVNADIRSLREKFRDHNDFWKYYYTDVTNKKYFDVKEKIHYETIKNCCKIPLVLCSINKWSNLPMLNLSNYSCSFIKNNGRFSYYKRHPTKDGHRLISEKILEKIEDIF